MFISWHSSFIFPPLLSAAASASSTFTKRVKRGYMLNRCSASSTVGCFFFFFASRAEMQMEVNGDQAVLCVCASLSSPGIWSKCWSGTWIALSRQSTRITYSRCWRWGIHEGNLDLLPFIYLRMFVRQKWIFLSSFCFRICHVSFDPSVSHAARKFNQQKPRASGAGDPHHFILMMYAEMYCRPVSVDE